MQSHTFQLPVTAALHEASLSLFVTIYPCFSPFIHGHPVHASLGTHSRCLTKGLLYLNRMPPWKPFMNTKPQLLEATKEFWNHFVRLEFRPILGTY